MRPLLVAQAFGYLAIGNGDPTALVFFFWILIICGWMLIAVPAFVVFLARQLTADAELRDRISIGIIIAGAAVNVSLPYFIRYLLN